MDISHYITPEERKQIHARQQEFSEIQSKHRASYNKIQKALFLHLINAKERQEKQQSRSMNDPINSSS